MTSTTVPRGAAFFDLDRTLISGSSAIDFGVVAWRQGMTPTRDLLTDTVNALVFRLAGSTDEDSETLRDRILGAVAGNRQDELLALNEQIIPRVLAKVRPESRNLVEMHHEAGRDCWIISASPIELVEPLAQALGMEGGIGTRSAVEDGIYTGALAAPFCYGDGKRVLLEELAEERGYDLRLSYSYSDSVSDLPMLELVGHPVAVNPDRSLQAVALQRGWPVVEFARRRKRVVRTTTAAVGAGALSAGGYLLGRRHGRLQSELRRGLSWT